MKQEKKLQIEERFSTAPDYRKTLAEELGRVCSPAAWRRILSRYHPGDIADALEALPAAERAACLLPLDGALLAEILEYAEDIPASLLELPADKRSAALPHLEASTLLEVLRALPPEESVRLAEGLPDEVQEELEILSPFSEDEIGSRMSSNLIRIPRGATIPHAMNELIAQAAECDNVSTVFAIDGDGRLCGALELKDLIVARRDTPLAPLIKDSYPFVYADTPIDECLSRLIDYSEDSIPVVDRERRLLGVIMARDFVEVVDDELGEDYARLAGLSAEEEAVEPIRASVGKRLPWLIVLLGLGMLVSGVVGLFEGVVARLTVIMSFQSLILAMAGNVGTQSLAVTIRMLMDEQISRRQKLTRVRREAQIGLCNGLLLGTISVLLVGAYLFLVRGESVSSAFAISGCIGLALVISMMIAAIFGTVIPMFFQRIRVDPAVASGPLITTVNDLVAVIAYYGMAYLLLIRVFGLGG